MPGGRRTARASRPWPAQPSFVGLRNDLLHSFSAALEPAGVLGRFQVRGIVAGFWDDAKYEFMTLMARGAKGVVDAWRTSILTALDDEQSKDNPLDHKLVKFLMAEFVEALAELEARKAELDSQIKAATPDKGAGEDGDDAEAGDDEPAVDEAQLKEWKKQLAALKKDIKAQEQGFARAAERGGRCAGRGRRRRAAAGDPAQRHAGDPGAVHQRAAAAGRRGVRELVGQVPGDVDRDRARARRGCSRAATRSFGSLAMSDCAFELRSSRDAIDWQPPIGWRR